MILKRGNIELIPTEDLDYIIECAEQYKYKKVTNIIARGILKDYGYKFWEVYCGEAKSGVVYISYIPKLGYTLDAYKDKTVDNEIKNSFIAGKLVVDWFLKNEFPVLWTIHDERNRMATLLCKKLGFEIKDTLYNGLGKFVLMRRDK